MKIVEYSVELNTYKNPILVKEKDVEYAANFSHIQMATHAVDIMNNVYRLNKKAEEYVYALALDNSGHLIGIFELSHGTVNMSPCQTRELFIRLLLVGASGYIVVHNHPSGNVYPSKEDNSVVTTLQKSSDIISISLLDFIIIGNETHYSFAEKWLNE